MAHTHLIAQIMPDDTAVHEVLEGPKEGYHHRVFEIVICNHSVAGKTYDLYHGKVIAGALGAKNALAKNAVIGAKEFLRILSEHGWVIDPGERFGVLASSADDITFTFYGTLNEKEGEEMG